MVVGVLGELVAKPVVLGLRQGHATTLHQQMEEPSVLDLQVKVVTPNHVPQVHCNVQLMEIVDQ